MGLKGRYEIKQWWELEGMAPSESYFEDFYGESFFGRRLTAKDDGEEGVEEFYISDENSRKIESYSIFKDRFEWKVSRGSIPWINHGEIIFDEIKKANEIIMGRFLWPANAYAMVKA